MFEHPCLSLYYAQQLRNRMNLDFHRKVNGKKKKKKRERSAEAQWILFCGEEKCNWESCKKMDATGDHLHEGKWVRPKKINKADFFLIYVAPRFK